MSFTKYTNRLYYFPKPNRWQKGIGAELPESYKKFWREWKIQRPTAVHYVETPGKYEWKPLAGAVLPVQNIPLPLRYPKEIDDGIWGGEAVVQGYVKKGKYKRPMPKFWVPKLLKSVVYSEVLDHFMRTIVTRRTIDLIHEHYGFDHYLLKTPACDLRSLLALKFKRNILIALADKTLYPDDPVKREEVYEKYQQYLSSYTREDIEWYGLSYEEACRKHIFAREAENIANIKPLKIKYRAELIEKLEARKQERLLNPEKVEAEEEEKILPAEKPSWISRINPFSKSPKA